MANTVKMKQSAVAGKVPTTGQLALGELAINTVDGKLFLKKNVAGTETIVDVTGAASGVSSFNTRTGAVTLQSADVTGALGFTPANNASPALTGTPTAPTAAQGTNTTQLATTAFVNAEIAADAAPIGHVGATGTAHGVATTAVAGFMSSTDKSKLDGIAAGAQVNAVTSVAGRTGAVTLAVADVSGAAPLASPGLTGTPTAPTAAQGTSTTQLATTAFVNAEIAADAVTKTSSTGAAQMPVGTTAQRPAAPSSGMFRMNSTTGEPEWYDAVNSIWVRFQDSPIYSVEYLVIGGGGGGGGYFAGGGGGGGLVNSSGLITPGVAYSVTIGAGGGHATNGSNSIFGSMATAIGGGRGAAGGGGGSYVPGSGGSGGGGGAQAGYNTGGAGTSGQGYAGGSTDGGGGAYGGGGGGGASAVGGYGSSAGAGAGGPGSSAFSAWASATGTGASGAYAGGGGGGQGNASPGANGGIGGGGNGGYHSTASGAFLGAGTNGTANTGGGGGSVISGINGAAGGSGLVVIRYQGPQRGSGGTVSSSGGYTYHTFTTSGTFTG